MTDRLKFWIRVNARLAVDPDVQSFAYAILPSKSPWLAVSATCGLLITLWGRVADERENADLNGIPDQTIELWANWQGKRGLFASEFRARFVDERGIIREWATYQGKLVERRAKDRTRKRGGNSAGSPHDTPQEVHDDGGGNPLPNGNVNSLVSGSYEPERQERAPVALAPEGARSAPKVNGGVPGAPPTRDDPDAKRYDTRLYERCEAELGADPDLAHELEQEARKHLAINPRAQLPEWQARIVRGEVHERLRKRNGWQSFDEWQESKRAKVPA